MTTMSSHGQTPQGYQVHIAGHLDAYWSAWFDGLAIIQLDDGTTVLRGIRLDQAELHGLLAKIRDLGVTLISVTPVEQDGLCDRAIRRSGEEFPFLQELSPRRREDGITTSESSE